jgi:uncharacterized membrane protein
MSKFSPKEIATAGLVAAIYTVLSLVFMPISFGVYQVRIAEALTVLPFLSRAAVPGLYVGCLLANILGGLGWLDIVFGPLITLAAALLTRWAGQLNRRRVDDVLALIPWLLLSGAVAYLMMNLRERPLFALGELLILTGVVALMITVRLQTGRQPLSLLLAPLPPVLLNAFGVSAYLAPLIAVPYWFCVQMIGIGQLVACYFLGLPLLMLLRRRKIFY